MGAKVSRAPAPGDAKAGPAGSRDPPTANALMPAVDPWDDVRALRRSGIRNIQTSLLEAREIMLEQRKALDAERELESAAMLQLPAPPSADPGHFEDADVDSHGALAEAGQPEPQPEPTAGDYRVLVACPVHEEPGHRSKQLGTVAAGDLLRSAALQLDAFGGEWVHCVRYNKDDGWISLLAADGYTLQAVEDLNTRTRKVTRKLKQAKTLLTMQSRLKTDAEEKAEKRAAAIELARARCAGEPEPEEEGEEYCVLISKDGGTLGRRLLEVGVAYVSRGKATAIRGWAAAYIFIDDVEDDFIPAYSVAEIPPDPEPELDMEQWFAMQLLGQDGRPVRWSETQTGVRQAGAIEAARGAVTDRGTCWTLQHAQDSGWWQSKFVGKHDLGKREDIEPAHPDQDRDRGTGGAGGVGGAGAGRVGGAEGVGTAGRERENPGDVGKGVSPTYWPSGRFDNGAPNTRGIQDATISALQIKPGDVILECGFWLGQAAAKVAAILGSEASRCELHAGAQERLAAQHAATVSFSLCVL